MIDDLAGLVWAANLATLELHPYLGRLPDLNRPVELVFDLDPGLPAGFAQACAVALALRGILDNAGLRAWPKVSGAKGLHLQTMGYAGPPARAR